MAYQVNQEYLKQLGSKIRSIRKSKGITQELLANNIGVEISQISLYYHIAKFLNVPLSQLFEFKEGVP